MSRATWFLPALCVALLAACLPSATAFAADSGCQPVFDAMSKVLTTPAHVFSTEIGWVPARGTNREAAN